MWLQSAARYTARRRRSWIPHATNGDLRLVSSPELGLSWFLPRGEQTHGARSLKPAYANNCGHDFKRKPAWPSQELAADPDALMCSHFPDAGAPGANPAVYILLSPPKVSH